MSRRGSDDQLRLEAEDLVARLASCPECGTLCQRYRGHGLADGQLFDLNPRFVPWSHLPDWVAQAVDRQGIGVGWGRSHVCPPTRVAMTPAAGSDWDLIGEAS